MGFADIQIPDQVGDDVLIRSGMRHVCRTPACKLGPTCRLVPINQSEQMCQQRGNRSVETDVSTGGRQVS